jgi:hypothetical protein
MDAASATVERWSATVKSSTTPMKSSAPAVAAALGEHALWRSKYDKSDDEGENYGKRGFLHFRPPLTIGLGLPVATQPG